MLMVISPAKTLDYETPAATSRHTLPEHLQDAAQLIELLRELSPAQVAEQPGPVVVAEEVAAGLHQVEAVSVLVLVHLKRAVALPHAALRAERLHHLAHEWKLRDQVVRRVVAVQERLGRQILLENVSSYLTFAHSTLSEWEFLGAVAEGADCGILLDVNNVYVSATNHGFSAEAYLDGLPADRIGQIHLAGHTDMGRYLLDTHDGPVIEAVWELYRQALRRFGRVSTLVEWDDAIPDLDVVCAEAERARAVEALVLESADVAAR